MDRTEIARKLRRDETPHEKILWPHLKNRKLEGKKFHRQYPIRYYSEGIERFFVADFYCAELNLVVELDGRIHETRKEYDQMRDNILTMKGLKVIRFKNDEIENKLDDVLLRIKAEI